MSVLWLVNVNCASHVHDGGHGMNGTKSRWPIVHCEPESLTRPDGFQYVVSLGPLVPDILHRRICCHLHWPTTRVGLVLALFLRLERRRVNVPDDVIDRRATLPTLLAIPTTLVFALPVLSPFLYEAFVVPTNALAPTLVG